jgi:capsular exopolysaccharide synthesis family protein
MSQLELALKKARELEAAALGRAPVRSDADSRVAKWAFKSAWDFEASEESVLTRTETPAAPPNPGPQQAKIVSPRFRDFNAAVREKLVVGEYALPLLREQFRKVAASIYNLQKERQRNVLMIVSAVPGEGKTLTATNLALTLSESYRSRVLLVDTDLRRPSIHHVFAIPNTSGLKEALSSDSDGRLSSVTVSPRLEVLTAGSADIDPMGALTSDLLRRKLAEAARSFDWVILDTPPVGLLPDATILAGLADLAVLVVEAASTKCELSLGAVDAIGRDRVIGVVLNQLHDTKRVQYDGYRDYHDEQSHQRQE